MRHGSYLSSDVHGRRCRDRLQPAAVARGAALPRVDGTHTESHRVLCDRRRALVASAALELDLSSRPTVRQFTDAQATIEMLRRALPTSPHESSLRRGPGASLRADPVQERSSAVLFAAA